MNANSDEYYRKHFEGLAEQHRKQYEYYKKKANDFAKDEGEEK